MTGHTLRVDFDDGECVEIAPDRAISAVATSKDCCTVWYYDDAQEVHNVEINAEVEHVLQSLSLPSLGHTQ